MQLYLDSFGAYLFVRNGMFAVRVKSGGEQLFAVRQVGAILLTAGTGMSSDAVLLAAAENIPLLLIDANTHKPLAQLGSGRSVSLASIRRNQAIFSKSRDGYAWAAGVLSVKVERQMALLQTVAGWGKAPPQYAERLPTTLKTMAAQARALKNWSPPPGNFVAAIAAERLRGQEGTASRVFFQQLACYLDGRLDFTGRQGRPAYDPFNALLNYLYGMMYTAVHLAALKSGLDPFMAALHADQFGAKPTLVYDMVEPFRPWADEVALLLAADPLMSTESYFLPDPDGRGLWLSGHGKGAVLEAMLGYLKTPTPFDGRNVRRSIQVDLEAQKLAVFLKDYGET
jgi:CRISPR-associated protein Cas1